MCVTSMIGDYYRERWQYMPNLPPATPYVQWPNFTITRTEFDELKKEVLEMKELLKRAKKYDEETGQKDCEMDEKVIFLKKIAELVGVSLNDIFPING